MKILGIDTSSKILSIALSEGRELIAEETIAADRRHAALLVPKIKELLEHSGFGITGVDVFVAGTGPGSFTGLRIGVSTVKGFGIATGKPCIGVPSIDAIALNVKEDSKLIVPIIDAKRHQVYSAIYMRKKGHVIRKSKFLLLTIEGLVKKINLIRNRPPVFFLGDAITLYEEEMLHICNEAVFLGEEYWYPRAANLIQLALGKLDRLKKMDLTKLKPIYLYPKDCQVKP